MGMIDYTANKAAATYRAPVTRPAAAPAVRYAGYGGRFAQPAQQQVQPRGGSILQRGWNALTNTTGNQVLAGVGQVAQNAGRAVQNALGGPYAPNLGQLGMIAANNPPGGIANAWQRVRQVNQSLATRPPSFQTPQTTNYGQQRTVGMGDVQRVDSQGNQHPTSMSPYADNPNTLLANEARHAADIQNWVKAMMDVSPQGAPTDTTNGGYGGGYGAGYGYPSYPSYEPKPAVPNWYLNMVQWAGMNSGV